LDPSGTHLIISTTEENYYLHKSWKNGKKPPRALSKSKGVLFESVAWDSDNTDPNQTGSILVGTTTGVIYELNIDATLGGNLLAAMKGPERVWKALYSLQASSAAAGGAELGGSPGGSFVGTGTSPGINPSGRLAAMLNSPLSISGLRWFRFPHQPSKLCVLATTATRVYQFVGLNTFEQLFAHYQDNIPDFQEFPPESLRRSELASFLGDGGRLPKSIAWLTGPGVFLADVQLGSQNPGEGVLENSTHIPYPFVAGSMSGSPSMGMSDQLDTRADSGRMPVSMLLTEFHYVLLYANAVVFAVSRLTNDVVYEGRFPIHHDMIGLAHDPLTGITFAYSSQQVFEIHVRNEDKNVWAMYLQKGQFGLAQQYCREAWQRDRVYTAQADYYFQKKQFERAAQHYGKTSKSFEEVTLKFIHIGEHDALRAFLKEKLTHMRANDEMQMTIICTWLTELYLSKLNSLDAEAAAAAASAAAIAAGTAPVPRGGTPLPSAAAMRLDKMEETAEEFRLFLEEYSSARRKVLDPVTTFNLISSHGRTKELLFYASVVKDYDKVIGYHIQQGQYDMALEVLVKQREPRLFYKHCPVLMVNSPFKLVNILMTEIKELVEPRQLIPALMRYKHHPSATTASGPPSDASQHQAIRYLQYCVNQLRNRDPAIHNFLLSLYAQSDNDAALLSFLKQKETYFDLEYALRLCNKHNKQRACVLIFSKMGLYEEAVDLALKVDIELAKQTAQMPPEDDVDTRKKLWLRIARHVVEEEKDITKAMKFLQNTDLLKIEDILPFFPDFVLIDDFKDEICRSLQEYNKHIENLESEMKDATGAAEVIRQDIENLKNKFGYVSGNQSCELCRLPVLTRAFYLFPCQHVYHRSCLAQEIRKHVGSLAIVVIRTSTIHHKMRLLTNDYITDEFKGRRITEILDVLRRRTAGATPAAPIRTAGHSESGLFSSGPAAGLASALGGIADRLTSDSSLSGTLPPISTVIEISPHEQQELQEELDRYVGAECPLCGEAMIKSIAKPFVELDQSRVSAQQADIIRSWEI
jgi:tetratricopeptide (TPR) repeat protein